MMARLRNVDDRSDSFCVCKLIASTYAGESGTINTWNLTFTKPATSSSKLDDDGEKRREVDSEYRFHLISSGLLTSQPGLAWPACLTLEIGNFD